MRPLFLEFPNEESLYTNSTATAFEFLAGEWLLAAPVYDDRVTRDGIYLPLGPASPDNTVWVDWWNGTQVGEEERHRRRDIRTVWCVVCAVWCVLCAV